METEQRPKGGRRGRADEREYERVKERNTNRGIGLRSVGLIGRAFAEMKETQKRAGTAVGQRVRWWEGLAGRLAGRMLGRSNERTVEGRKQNMHDGRPAGRSDRVSQQTRWMEWLPEGLPDGRSDRLIEGRSARRTDRKDETTLWKVWPVCVSVRISVREVV